MPEDELYQCFSCPARLSGDHLHICRRTAECLNFGAMCVSCLVAHELSYHGDPIQEYLH
jgi:hypothetical protein